MEEPRVKKSRILIDDPREVIPYNDALEPNLTSDLMDKVEPK
jgi:hypothetical protein